MTFPSRSDRFASAHLGRLCGEAIRNRAARLPLTLTLLLVWCGSALAVYVTERDAAQSNAAYTSLMLRDGYTTILIDQSDGAPEAFTWANCSTLHHQRGVRAVVGLGETVTLRLWDASGPEVAVRETMGDVAGFFATTSPSRVRRWTSPSMVFDVDALGARPASAITTEFVTRVVQKNGDSATLAAVTENLTAFGGGFSGNAIMLAPSGGEISTCVVLADLDMRDQVETTISGLFPVSGGYGQQWALTNAERFESPRDQYEQRPSRWYWLGAVALITLTWTLSLWILRGDLAVFSVAGLGARQIFGLAIAELLVVALGVAVIILGVATFDMYTHAEASGDVAIGVREILRAAIAGFGACAAVAALTASTISRRTLDALKDR